MIRSDASCRHKLHAAGLELPQNEFAQRRPVADAYAPASAAKTRVSGGYGFIHKFQVHPLRFGAARKQLPLIPGAIKNRYSHMISRLFKKRRLASDRNIRVDPFLRPQPVAKQAAENKKPFSWQ
jgi:hypothetical protein